jgi:tRNA nucleotidyltransferase (CCA-adding enzyme)
MKKIDNLLKEVLEKSKPTEEELNYIKANVDIFSQNVKKNIKKYKIDAEIFVGGSFAKGTVIKKDNYDVDIFIRYDKKYKNEEISAITKKILGNSKDITIIHGSRDYFRINQGEKFFIELIPVKKIKNPKEYENITDLSYLHVKYINKNIKSSKILDDIKITKAFCYANHCYGAESYIHGFSGYSLELLVYYYKSFMNFAKAMSKPLKEKLIVDIEKQFKNKKDVLMDLNSSKLNSPIILIDPTYKQRNALAALSQETFEKFQKVCKEFVKNPSMKYFEFKKVDILKIKEDSLKKNREFILIETKTDKQEGDIAGSKLLKFYNYLEKEISKFFNVRDKGFNYNNKKSARYFFVAEKKKEILYPGPFTNDRENCINFKRQHKDVYELKGRLYAKEKVNNSLKEFLNKWKINNAKIIKEMYIQDLNIFSGLKSP